VLEGQLQALKEQQSKQMQLLNQQMEDQHHLLSDKILSEE
jgi:hypothetical protein